ncbi:MAG: class I SAM-dependent methyltransferase, partial [Halothiobacillus sp.]|nr:class I SAM-dependent methyltransferase [Halothiobacillus sp.]
QHHPASGLGQWVARLLPGQRQKLDKGFRYLPKPAQGQRLLDIGCGNGDFLVSAQEAGWQVLGLEPDPKAAATTRQRGLDVTVGTVDILAGESSSFDAITLSHVIEHVHEPVQLLQAVHRLLKPGGVVYIDTPNIQSHGAQLFWKNWRGLETPRHLALFNPASLTGLLSASGFDDIKMERRTAVQQGMYLMSLRMATGRSPYGLEPARLTWLTRLRLSLSNIETARLEFITLTARKMNA